jgi:hypothetical protein
MASAAPSFAAKAAKAAGSTSSLSKNLLRGGGGSGSGGASDATRPAMPALLSKLLVAPSRVANALEWNTTATGRGRSWAGGGGGAGTASVLTVNVTRDAMELLVAYHPMLDEPVQTLPSIPLKTEILRVPHSKSKEQQEQQEEGHPHHRSHQHHHHRSSCRRRLVPAVAMEFKQILQDWQVAGIVVNWPVQREGWCGYSCGKVLFVMDHLHSYSCFAASSKQQQQQPPQPPRPMCLWDQVHHDAPSYEDEWGRSELYTITSAKSVHCASEEQYDVVVVPSGASSAVAGVWDDFCRAHWPECYACAPPPPPPAGLLRSPPGRQPWLSTVPPTLRNSNVGGPKNLRGG